MIELHCHTTASDGTLCPEELVAQAASIGLTHLAITDHDTTGAWAPACRAAVGTGIEMIPGIEISCYAAAREVHVLGYFFNPDDAGLQALLEDMRATRVTRMQEMLQRLAELGLEVSYGEVADRSKGSSIGRPHLAEAMVEKGWVKNIDEAFERYLRPGKPGYVARQSLSPAEAIQALHHAGGLCVLAHPVLLRDNTLVARLLDEGFDGLEVWHPSHGSREVKRYRRLARNRGLLTTGGSDFHRPDCKSRPGLGQVKVDPAVVESMRARSSRFA
ncbi:MAG: PHP domain-containing protein [Vulcanimicrobiota bacterium]